MSITNVPSIVFNAFVQGLFLLFLATRILSSNHDQHEEIRLQINRFRELAELIPFYRMCKSISRTYGFVWRASQIYTCYIMLLLLTLKLAISLWLTINGFLFSLQFTFVILCLRISSCCHQVKQRSWREKKMNKNKNCLAHNMYLLCSIATMGISFTIVNG